MSSLLTISTMFVVMLLHAGFGCCWHHDHAAHGGQQAIAKDSSATGCPHGHHHGPASQEQGDSEAPRPESDECQGDCVFVTGGSPSVGDFDSARMEKHLPGAEAASVFSRMRTTANWNWNRMPTGDVSPRALRPLLCVWQV